MTELFNDILPETKKGLELVFDSAISNYNPVTVVKILDAYTNILNEKEQDFARFYFNMRMQQLLNESDSNNMENMTYEGNNY